MRFWFSISLLALFLVTPSFGEGAVEAYEKLKLAFEEALEGVDEHSQKKQDELREKYVGALAKLSTELQESGDLAGVLEVRKEQIEAKEGGVPKAKVKSVGIIKLRDVYRASLSKILTERVALRRAKVEIYRKQLPSVIAALTKDQEIEKAVAVKAEIKQLDTVATQAGDGSSAPTDDPVRLVRIPTTRPAVEKNPFGKSSWKESFSFPKGRYDFNKSKSMGSHGGGQTWYLASGGVYAGAGHSIQINGGRFISEGCQFRDLTIRADHTGSCYFMDCKFENSKIQERGTWYGYGNYDAKFYFENCQIDGSLVAGNINIYYFGLCMSRCNVKDAQLPSIDFHKGEPASRKKDSWLTVKACRFENCRVPLSFLLITSDCLFINCRFEDDKKPPSMKKELEVTYFTKGCTDMFSKTPYEAKLVEKSTTKLTFPVGVFSK